jgi:hypothetical protein
MSPSRLLIGAELQEHEGSNAGGSDSVAWRAILTRAPAPSTFRMPSYPLDRLSRYGATLWRQAYPLCCSRSRN